MRLSARTDRWVNRKHGVMRNDAEKTDLNLPAETGAMHRLPTYAWFSRYPGEERHHLRNGNPDKIMGLVPVGKMPESWNAGKLRRREEEDPDCLSPINILHLLIASTLAGLQSVPLDVSVSLESGVRVSSVRLGYIYCYPGCIESRGYFRACQV